VDAGATARRLTRLVARASQDVGRNASPSNEDVGVVNTTRRDETYIARHIGVGAARSLVVNYLMKMVGILIIRWLRRTSPLTIVVKSPHNFVDYQTLVT